MVQILVLTLLEKGNVPLSKIFLLSYRNSGQNSQEGKKITRKGLCFLFFVLPLQQKIEQNSMRLQSEITKKARSGCKAASAVLTAGPETALRPPTHVTPR